LKKIKVSKLVEGNKVEETTQFANKSVDENVSVDEDKAKDGDTTNLDIEDDEEEADYAIDEEQTDESAVKTRKRKRRDINPPKSVTLSSWLNKEDIQKEGIIKKEKWPFCRKCNVTIFVNKLAKLKQHCRSKKHINAVGFQTNFFSSNVLKDIKADFCLLAVLSANSF